MQQSVTLDTISVTAGEFGGAMPFFATNTAYYTFGVPNMIPGMGNVGMIDKIYALNSGLVMVNVVEDTVNRFGAQGTRSLLESFATIDRMTFDAKSSAAEAFFAARFQAAQRWFTNNWQSDWLSGQAFSPAKALVNYIQQDGRDLKVDINTIGLNVRPQDIKPLKDILNFAAPGTYNFNGVQFGYQTYKDSIITGAYLGGIVLKATGNVTIADDRSYSYNYEITSAKPDLYDADAKAAGKRPWYAEMSTTFLRSLPGKEYHIEILGNKNFSGHGDPNSLNDVPAISNGTEYDDVLFQFGDNKHLQGGKGNDVYVVDSSSTYIHENNDEGFDFVVSTASFALPENIEDLYLNDGALNGEGSNLDNAIMGNRANNDLRGRGGQDLIDGGEGFDRALYDAHPKDMLIVTHRGQSIVMTQHEGVDQLQKIEVIRGSEYDYHVRDNLLQYIASYEDLSNYFGASADSNAAGVFDNLRRDNNYASRDVTFDGAEYLVSNRDVYQAYGFNPEEAARHYIQYGRAEGRSSNFDSKAYIASYGDLIQAFGTDDVLGAQHFLTNGEGEGRHSSFNPQAYIAANHDVAVAFNYNLDAATIHYISYGYAEGRGW